MPTQGSGLVQVFLKHTHITDTDWDGTGLGTMWPKPQLRSLACHSFMEQEPRPLLAAGPAGLQASRQGATIYGKSLTEEKG